MLSGEYRHSTDSKNRIFIPAEFRRELGVPFIVTRSFRGKFLRFCSVPAWERYLAPLMNAPRKTTEDTLRFLYRAASTVEPDSQGRIVLPAALVEYAEIGKTAYIIGVGEYGEIWSEDNYKKSVENENADEIKAALEDLGL